MTTAITTPEIGAGAQEVRVSSWLIDVGDTVETGDRVAELSLKGMTFDVAAPLAGTLQRISKTVDTVVAPGDILGWIDTRPDQNGVDEVDYGDSI